MTVERWSVAMQQALYGSAGFYRRELPSGHYRTSVHASAGFADAVMQLAASVRAQCDSGSFTVVDVGAGSGELIERIAAVAPADWQLVAVELRPRPADLHARVRWGAEIPRDITGLVIANEWLDNLPVDVATWDAGTWWEVLVDTAGGEAIGRALPAGARLEWLDRWWPGPKDGDRAEIGLARDAAWADVAQRLARGAAVAIDYGVADGAHRTGTLAGYRDGQLTDPVPDGSCDVTAHVHFAAVAAAGEASGLHGTRLLSQQEALIALGVSGRRPPLALASTDPQGYLRELTRTSEDAELLDAHGLGGFTWLVQCRGLDPDALPFATTSRS